MPSFFRSAVVASLALTFPAALAAQEPVIDLKEDPVQHGTFGFYFENDLFGGTDQRYTNGVRLSWTTPDLRKFSDSAWIGPIVGENVEDLLSLSENRWQRNISFVLGQNMYTPTDTLERELIEHDRPYAGWLYTGFGFIWKNARVRNSLTLNIGVVGPWAYAEEAQDFIHDLRDIEKAEGWDNQLGNEFGAVLAYQRIWRWPFKDRREGWDWETMPFLSASLGNVNISASLGAELRAGWNLPDDFGTDTINPAATTPTPVEGFQRAARSRWTNFGAHVFFRTEGRYVARDIFLDGNTFRDSHSVSKLPFVADISGGLSVNWRDMKVTYAYVYRTEEFRGQDDGQTFGSITVSIPF